VDTKNFEDLSTGARDLRNFFFDLLGFF
jgi:hypothetical protein